MPSPALGLIFNEPAGLPLLFIAFLLTPAGLVKLWEGGNHSGVERGSANVALEWLGLSLVAVPGEDCHLKPCPL